MGTTAFLTEQGGFGYQSAGQHQVIQFVGGAVGGWGQGLLPGSQDIGGLSQAFSVADDAYFIPVELLQGGKAGCWYRLWCFSLA